ncbi:type III restriction endonuclease subunit R [Chlorobium phaeovibrioides]|uniref:Type III restriction endonuclease subunit R n=1 Tax=Chlorobium phaeovibrioides TaxID=1094 RepID=A0A5M8IAP4_CHLPH|nr:DEAD/DEAH box helicase family protein [Chlorobium phaeovibrioides]KAA6232513.1 type III restriction endonuclease subunit R [Chlorobium phaeovibrioides]
MSRTQSKKRSFHEELVLNQWMMGFFKGGSLQALKNRLGEDRHEGIEDDGQTGFFHELHQNLFEVDRISEQTLRRYDLNIIGHWNAITEQRNKVEGVVLNMKYFQYLSLLFTEIYLDWYFNHRQQLLDGLNDRLQSYNGGQETEYYFQRFEADELNKLAYWNATGSGKTLLLHVNIRQYLHYFHNGNTEVYPDKIILLTPNEGLSRQHLSELQLSGFGFCSLFDKNRSVVRGAVEVIDINKLGDEMGDKTVAIEAFEGNNLVLVDEGHRGTGTAAGAWMSRRESLVRGGFAFEYSATFGQAVAKGLTVFKAEDELRKKKSKVLFDTTNLKKLDAVQKQQLVLTSDEKRKARTLATREIYAKSILFDYSYKYFYEDGYGKESLILNLKEKDYSDEAIARKYFTACLLSFYQQQYLWNAHRAKLTDFNIDKPLWIFVGNTVAGENSDILNVLQFLAGFLNDEAKTKGWLIDLLANTALLPDEKGRNIFHDRFTPLMQSSADEVYSDILRKLFNSDAPQRLKVVNLKSSKGELALRVGDAEPFGLINIGDDSGFFKEAENLSSFDTESDDFGGSMFGTLNNKESRLHVLIGSRKFTEGWSSWRVSTMGLLNMGKGEGSQIIQLFGRGVRLKGKEYSLKRSTPGQRPKGLHMERLETLNIFGVNAGYMATFKEYLKEEGVTTTDEMIELDFKTCPNLPKSKLKTLSLKDGYKDNQLKGFKRTHFPWLYEVLAEFSGKIKTPHIDLDLYPRIEAMSSKVTTSVLQEAVSRNTGKIATATMALFDFDRIYLAVQEFKYLRSWSNLRLERQRLEEFCLKHNDWYTLFIPQSELSIRNISDISKQEDILIRLLQDYTDRFYKSLKTAYEGQFYDIVHVKEEDDSLLKVYHFDIDDTEEGEEYKKKIEALQVLVSEGRFGEASKWNAGQMVAICFDSHLYYPLFAGLFDGAVPLKMRPLAFDAPSEVQFVRDLEAFYKSPSGHDVICKRSLYLLRNADTKAKGLGFALAGNFYPDFLLWLVDDTTGEQWLNFIDPKGLRQMNLNDPKLGLYKEVKVIQTKLGDPKLTLNAFILSATRFEGLLNVSCQQKDLEERNVLFMTDGGAVYLRKMFERVG